MQSARTKSEAGILVLVVFLLGGLVGGVGNHLWGSRIWASANPPHGGGRPPAGPSFSQRLGLSADQQKQLDAIFNESRPQFQALDAQHDALRMQTRAKIRAVLTSDQQIKFDAMMKDQDSHGRGRGPGAQPGGGPGPHPGPGF